jgi:hypothetical protein
LGSFTGGLKAATQNIVSGSTLVSGVGSVTVFSPDVSVPITGALLSVAQGVIQTAIATALAGGNSTAISGLLTAIAGQTTILPGQQVSGAIGGSVVAITVPLNGQTTTLYAGSLVTAANSNEIDWVIVESGSHTVLCSSQEHSFSPEYLRKDGIVPAIDRLLFTKGYSEIACIPEQTRESLVLSYENATILNPQAQVYFSIECSGHNWLVETSDMTLRCAAPSDIKLLRVETTPTAVVCESSEKLNLIN